MQSQNIFLTNRNLQDLNPLIAGHHRCDPGHSFGPAVRKYTLIHYVISGTGTLYARGEAYSVRAGQAFIILPGEVTTYTADQEDPWYYCWVGFNGKLSARFASLPAVFTPPTDLFAKLERLTRDPSVAEYRLSGELMQLYAALFAESSDRNPHVQKVENFIRASYMYPIRVEDIAEQLNLNRRYLSRLYKEHTGNSMQAFLIKVRMEEGRRLLQEGCSVTDAAHLAGYEDVSNFSKMFKKHYGVSPAFYNA